MIEIDLHGLELVDAKTEIYFKILENNNDDTVLIVHGYKQGKILRNYIRSARFITDMKKQGISLSISGDCGDHEGTTTFKYIVKK
jgi:hypothetical protein